MSWIGTAVSVGTTIYGASQQKKAAKAAAQASKPTPYAVSGPAGTVGVSGNQITLNPSGNPFYDLFGQGGAASLANAFTAPGAFLYGADPELAAAYQGLQGPQLQAAGQERSALLAQLARPQEQRDYNTLQDRLFASGRLGTSGGGIQQEAFQNALNRADLERQLAGQDWAQNRAQNRFASALQAVQSGQMGARQSYDIGAGAAGAQGNIFQQLLDQARIGVGAGGGQAPGAAMAAAQTPSWQQAAIGAAQQGGLFDWMGQKAGSWFGGGATSVPAINAATGPVNVTAPNFQTQDFGFLNNIPQF